MLRNKKFIIFVYLIISVLLNSCAIVKPKQSKQEKDPRIDAFNFNYYFLEANKQKILGNYTEAINNYSLATKIDPKQSAVYYEIAGLLSLNKDYSAALKYAQKAVDVDKFNNIYYKLLLAKLYQDNNELMKSAKVMEDVLKNNPDNIMIYFELSRIYTKLKKYAQAIKVMDRAEKIFGINDQIALEKENIYSLMGQTSKAINEIEKLYSLNKNDPKYKALLAETYANNGMFDKAGELFKEIENEELPDGLIYLSIADYYRVTEDYENTMFFIRKAFESDDVDIDIKVKLLLSLYDIMGTDKDMQSKIKSLVEILRNMYPKNIKVRAVCADYYLMTYDYLNAQDELNFILSLDKEKYDIWNQALYVDYALNDFKSMYKHSKEAVSLFPNIMEFYRYYILSAYATQNYKDAAEAVDYVSSVPFYNQEIMLDFLNIQAESFYKLQEYEKSDSVYELIIDKNSEDLMAINNYSYFLALRNQKIQRAMELSEKLILAEPNNANYLDTRAYVLFRYGDYPNALEIINKALEIEPDNFVFLEHKGDILFKLGNIDMALEFWKKAIDSGSQSDVLLKKIESQNYIE